MGRERSHRISDAPAVSAYMLTFNNRRTVRRALAGLAWADEIVVVDSGSTDGTRQIAAEFTDRIVRREWPGFREQYQYAADQCVNDWVVFADADEVIPAGLAAEIQQEVHRNSGVPQSEQYAGYEANRRTWYLGRWIRHGGWVPDREIRVYNRKRASWQGGLHAKVHVRGPVGRLKGIYEHYTYADVAEHLQTIDRYSRTAAAEMLKAGRRTSVAGLFCRPLARFVRDYILKAGFLDGFPGLVVAVNTAFYVFVKHVKLREMRLADETGSTTPVTEEYSKP